MIRRLDENRCIKCIWYDKCKEYDDLSEDCDFFDSIEDEEDYWNEMSYRKYERSD